MTIALKDITIYPVVEQPRCTNFEVMGFFPALTKELLDENRSWLAPAYLDPSNNGLVLCIQSFVIKTPHHNILIDSCVGNHKERANYPFWNKMESDRYERNLAATGLGVKRTGAGQAAAVQGLCGAMSARMSVVILDRVAASEFAPAIRGMCGVPAGIMAGAPMAQVQSVIRGITSAGREPVLLATRPAELTAYGATPRHLVNLVTTQDAHDLTQPPSTTWPISYQLWMSAQSSSIPGA